MAQLRERPSDQRGPTVPPIYSVIHSSPTRGLRSSTSRLEVSTVGGTRRVISVHLSDNEGLGCELRSGRQETPVANSCSFSGQIHVELTGYVIRFHAR